MVGVNEPREAALAPPAVPMPLEPRAERPARARPRAAPNGEHHGGDQHQGGHDRPQQHAEDGHHHAEDERDEQVPVMGRGARSGPEPCAHGRNQRLRSGRILEMMKPPHAATRRYLPTSPFKPPPAAPPAEQFAVQDQVTHDRYGLGRVMSVEDDTSLVIDFGTQRVRITTPCAKLTKL